MSLYDHLNDSEVYKLQKTPECKNVDKRSHEFVTAHVLCDFGVSDPGRKCNFLSLLAIFSYRRMRWDRASMRREAEPL
jgi:hypothetical protein